MQVPIDGIIQDWQYWPGPWGSHNLIPTRYPDPAAMFKQLHERTSTPHFRLGEVRPGQRQRGTQRRRGIYPKVIPYVYPPGKGQWYDPFNPKAGSIYWSQMSKQIFAKGVDGWWLDASEPEISGHGAVP